MRLFGTLIHEVERSKSNLRRAVAMLAPGHTQAIVVELLAIYLPKSQIPRLGLDLGETLRGASA